MGKTLILKNLMENNWIMLDRASKTKTPPMIRNNNFCLVNITIIDKAAPKIDVPTSPMNILAG